MTGMNLPAVIYKGIFIKEFDDIGFELISENTIWKIWGKANYCDDVYGIGLKQLQEY